MNPPSITAYTGTSVQQFAVEGSFWITQTPTPGTGVSVTTATQVAFGATAPAFLIRNTAAAGGKDIIIKRLRLIVVGTGLGLTSLESLCVVDSTNRYSSGGVLMTAYNAKADEASASIAQIYNASTAIVATAAGASARPVTRHKVKAAAPVVSDTFVTAYASEPAAVGEPLTGTAATLYAQGSAPLIVPPQATGLIYLWAPAMTTAPTFEIQIEHVER